MRVAQEDDMTAPTTRDRSETRDERDGRLDGVLERMQTPAARRGMKKAFGASPEELGQAAIDEARRRNAG
jgi:hypothetical protein